MLGINNELVDSTSSASSDENKSVRSMSRFSNHSRRFRMSGTFGLTKYETDRYERF